MLAVTSLPETPGGRLIDSRSKDYAIGVNAGGARNVDFVTLPDYR